MAGKRAWRLGLLDELLLAGCIASTLLAPHNGPLARLMVRQRLRRHFRARDPATSIPCGQTATSLGVSRPGRPAWLSPACVRPESAAVSRTGQAETGRKTGSRAGETHAYRHALGSVRH